MKRILLIALLSFTACSAFFDLMPQVKLDQLEKIFHGKIGVYAIDTNTNQVITYHADDHFPVQSTMKLIAVSALFKQSNVSGLFPPLFN